MFSKTTTYAIRAAVLLAQKTGRYLTANELARDADVPIGYMSKVLRHLARAELVVSQRGPGGGFCLAVPPEELSILKVVVAVEPLAEVARPAPVPFSIGPNIGSALLTERLKQVAATRNSRAVRDECQSVCASRASA